MREKEIDCQVGNLLQKQIYLMGKDAAICRFLERYGDRISVSAIVMLPSQKSGTEGWASLYQYFYSKEENLDLLKQYVTVPFLENPSHFSGGTIIICQDGVYSNTVEHLLDYYGYEYGRDYTFDFLAAAVLDARAVLIIHGYFCFARDLFLALKTVPAVQSKYLVFACTYEVESNMHYHRGLNDLVKLCGVYIYNQEQRHCYFDVNQLPVQCLRIVFPCINFGGLYPQVKRVNLKYMNECFIEPHGASLPYIFGDSEMNRMLRQGIPTDTIVRTVCAEDYYDASTIKKQFTRELRIMRLYERNCDVKLTCFFEENYKTSRLLCCNDHWMEPLVIECAKQILQLLSIQDIGSLNSFINPKRYTQIPIYPSVATALNLSWVSPETTYIINWATGQSYSTFAEYAKRYCEVIRRMIEIKKEW